MQEKRPETRISPHFSADKLDNPSIDDVIDVFEDRVVYWILEPARTLLSMPFGDPASTCLTLTYFESIWVYIGGTKSNDRSKASFRKGFVEVFRPTQIDPEVLGRVADVLYQDARCGFFHDGLFRQRIYFRRKPRAALEVTVPRVDGKPDPRGEVQSILIDAKEFFDEVERHFREVIARLRDQRNVDVRSRFFAICRELWGWDGEPVVVGLPG